MSAILVSCDVAIAQQVIHITRPLKIQMARRKDGSPIAVLLLSQRHFETREAFNLPLTVLQVMP